MLEKIAQINRWAVVGVFALLLIGGSIAWDRLMYVPAKQQRSAAQQELESANSQLSAQQAKLKAAEDKALDRSPMGEILVAKRAIPRKDNRDEALIEIDRYAKKANVQVKEITMTDQDTNAAIPETTSNGMTASKSIDFKIDAQSTYRSMILFIDELQGAVDQHRGKVYVRGRLFNAVDLTITTDPTHDTQVTEKLPPGFLTYSLTVRIYADEVVSTGDDPTSAIGATTPAATGAPGTTTPGAATTTPGATSTTPGATTTTPGATTPGATSSTPAASGTTPSTQAVPPGAS